MPIRHQSERVPGKNYRDFGGRPLFEHMLTTLLDTAAIAVVVVDTDSPIVRERIATGFPSVVLIDRPTELRGGDVPMNDVLLHDIERVPSDWYLQTHCTNPLLRAVTIERGLQTLFASLEAYDSLFAVTPMFTRLWWPNGKPINHDPRVLLRTQDLPPVLEENSNMYVFRGDDLRSSGNRIGTRPLLFEIARAEAWDIDEELDFMIGEMIYQRGHE